MTRPTLPVAIAGGGIGGLAAALALAQRGIPSIVCERRAAFLEDGAGIQIGPNGSRILQQLGVGDAMREIAATPDGLSVRDGASGRELTRLPLGAWMEQRHGAPYWTAHRKDLHAAIVARVEQHEMISLRFNTEILTWLDTDVSVEAVTSRAERISAQALIAADGLWSRLRHQVSPSAPPKPTGKSAFRCVIQRSAAPAGISPDDVGIWLAAAPTPCTIPFDGDARSRSCSSSMMRALRRNGAPRSLPTSRVIPSPGSPPRCESCSTREPIGGNGRCTPPRRCPIGTRAASRFSATPPILCCRFWRRARRWRWRTRLFWRTRLPERQRSRSRPQRLAALFADRRAARRCASLPRRRATGASII